MSVSVYWTPVPTHRTHLEGQSTLVAALENAFGDFPMTLTIEHVAILRAMAGVISIDTNPYHALADAIEKYDAIIVSKEY